jgi:nitroreductase
MPTLPLTPDELLTTTRAVRHRLDLTRPVPLDLIRECLDIARQAPSGSNTQKWHWVVLTQPELRRGIAELYRRGAADYLRTSREAAQRAGDVAGTRLMSSAEYLAEHLHEVPVLVLGCIETGRGLPSGNQAGLWGSLLPAAWSYQLAARARGLGTAWTTLHLAHEREAAQLLGIPESVRQGVLLPTAFYTGSTFQPAPRKPLDDVLHMEGW